MTKQKDLGLTSASKASTQQQNREDESLKYDLEFNEKNFERIILENLRLREEVTNGLREINQQKYKIIELSDTHRFTSTLSIAG